MIFNIDCSDSFLESESDEKSDDDSGSGRGSPFSSSGMSLDVLAQVASDRLEKEPPKNGSDKKKMAQVSGCM